MFPILAGSNPSGYNFTRSVRLRASASAYLSRTPASAGNRSTWTWSGWVKIGNLTSAKSVFSAGTDVNSINIDGVDGGVIAVDGTYNGTRTLRSTTAVFRDPSSWYHIVVALDTTQATDTNRIKVYVNGSQVSLPTANVGTWPAQNSTGGINNNVAHSIGRRQHIPDYYYDGHLTEVNFIDGQALTPSSFGSTNALTGVWQPAPYTGSYGTNGFILDFEDNSALTTSSNVGLGKDTSGNGNYWTTNNISITAGVTYDSMTDVPTLTSATAANFAVANPLQKGSYVTVSNGNLTVTGNTSADSGLALATIGKLTSGKWYWEYTQGTIGSDTCGVMTQNVDGRSLNNGEATTASYGVGARANGDVYGAEKTTSTITSWTTGDVIGLSLDCDNGAIYWSKNGTALNSGVPTSGASKTGAVGVWTPSSSKIITPSFGAYNGGFVNANFGQRPFAYTPPTGFVALNTYNLPDSTIVKGNTVMDATLYTGNGGTQAVVNTAGFKPDFVWLKSRSAAYDHLLFDSIRGTGKALFSSSTAAETTTNNMSAFNSNGFTALYDATYIGSNNSGVTMVGWQWQAGQGTTSSNTSGTITSTVSVNASAGFSVVTYTAQASGTGTVGHGLGVAPSLIITKPRANPYGWTSYHASLGNTQYIELNTTSAAATNSTVWNNTSPTSSVFTSGSAFAGNGTYVAYCWTPIAGYSAFGSLTGNGSTDGPMVYTGFQPKFILYKRTDSTGDWRIWDTARSPYNVMNSILYPNAADAELTASSQDFDFLSNGFKVRNSSAAMNASGGTYIYMAFATSPFKNSLAR